MIEAKEMVIGTCSKLVEHYAQKHSIENTSVRIRIDLEKVGSKPVFGVFDNSTLLERCTLKNIIHAAGGKGFSMIIGMQVRSVIKDIFVQSMKQLALNDPKDLFLLLYNKQLGNDRQPVIALYVKGKFSWSLSIEEIMEESLKQSR